MTAGLVAKARLWRARGPQGRFILHRLRHDGWCPVRGPVTRYHCCPACIPCQPGCTRETCAGLGLARSAWMGRVPTGPATMGGGV